MEFNSGFKGLITAFLSREISTDSDYTAAP